MKIALVHEWLVFYAGGERVFESFTNIWKDADVFALVDFLNDEQRKIILKGKHAHTTFIQKLPFAEKKFRSYLPLFPLAIESLNFSKYDVIISSSHAVTKGVRKKPNQLHISYCHSPMRYIWDEAETYFEAAKLNTGVKKIIATKILNYLRKWDLKTAKRPDYLLANSNYIAEKLKRIYNRESTVIYPPVDVDKFSCVEQKDDYYFVASRLVPYKKIDLIVEAFAQMPDKRLIIAGTGPELNKLKNNFLINVEFVGYQDEKALKELMQKAKAFVFSAEEDFGIVVVEAMACGTPVIALNKGGTAETVIDGKTGILFEEQTVEDIKDAVKRFEKIENQFNHKEIAEHTKKFSRQIFEEKMKNYVDEKIGQFFGKNRK
ncbi:MAG: glycosyltransferase [Ignavibacterium album]|uniref:glycosyltransferase n=1 Tax=Ignavibacterium album TaxID=591197 RepID=UPI0026F28943|nr:glycosyltransferase [Ignavibacterium album]MCX8105752.1 glycosyltransferase [Ignavibacterium album]